MSLDMNFAIVQFSTVQGQNRYDMTVIVPKKFLAHDQTKQMYVYYLTPPYTTEQEQLLSNLTRRNDLRPPQHWTHYKCTVLHWFRMYIVLNWPYTYLKGTKHF